MSPLPSVLGDACFTTSAVATVTDVEDEAKKRRRSNEAHADDGVDAGGKVVGEATRSRDWMSLPELAAYLVLKDLLPYTADVFSFGGVCKAWRSLFVDCKRELFSALPPLLVSSATSPGALGGFYSLPEGRFYRRKQPTPCLWERLFGESWVYAATRVVGVSHGYLIVIYFLSWSNEEDAYAFLVDPLTSPEVRIDLPRPPRAITGALMTAPPTSPGCVIVAMTGSGYAIYCRPGDTEWVCRDLKKSDDGDAADIRYSPGTDMGFNEVAFLNGQLYAFSRQGKLVVMELLFPRLRVVAVVETKGWVPRLDRLFALARLVESDGEILYIADRGQLMSRTQVVGADGYLCCAEEHRYVVSRLDLHTGEWVTLSTLGGDRSLFINRGRISAITSYSSSCVVAAATASAIWRGGGGGGDRIFSYCSSSGKLLVWNMRDGSVEHHPSPSGVPFADDHWLIPSFCYE